MGISNAASSPGHAAPIVDEINARARAVKQIQQKARAHNDRLCCYTTSRLFIAIILTLRSLAIILLHTADSSG